MGKYIKDLTTSSNISGTTKFPVSDGTNNARAATFSQVANYVNTALGINNKAGVYDLRSYMGTGKKLPNVSGIAVYNHFPAHSVIFKHGTAYYCAFCVDYPEHNELGGIYVVYDISNSASMPWKYTWNIYQDGEPVNPTEKEIFHCALRAFGEDTATNQYAGRMSASDKQKLDSIEMSRIKAFNKPIVHKTIPLKARVGSRYVFSDGHIKFGKSISRTGWGGEYLNGIEVEVKTPYPGRYTHLHIVKSEGYVDGDIIHYGVNRENPDTYTSPLSPVVVEVLRRPSDYVLTGNPMADFANCFKIYEASGVNGETASPHFTLDRGVSVCTKAPIQITDGTWIYHQEPWGVHPVVVKQRKRKGNPSAGKRYARKWRRMVGDRLKFGEIRIYPKTRKGYVSVYYSTTVPKHGE